MIIGIIGVGFVGKAIYDSFKNKKYTILPYDKYKNIGKFENIFESDIVFLALPTLFNEDTQKYDIDALEETCNKLKNNNYKGTIIIKSTIEPGTTNYLSSKYNLNLIHNPEFLTARTALHDFENQIQIVLGCSENCSKKHIDTINNLYLETFPNSFISNCTSNESELMKISLNCFYAVKVQFFNELYLMCKNTDINYENVKKLMLNNNWINPMHTNVPGPDGKLSYGGMCFPKDTNALLNFMKRIDTPHAVLKATVKERNIIRNSYENIDINSNIHLQENT